VGLREGFLLAGARALTMSLWEVPAKETPEQMEKFYDLWLGRGSGKSGARVSAYEAFHGSQLAALREARRNHQGSGHPFFWAGTIYVGDPGDLKSMAVSPEPTPSASAAK
jgi:CHAT domain-containing protein